MFNVNVKALINVTKNVTKKMVDAGIKGSVVNVSSLVCEQYIMNNP
jgi:short-subunit dehydrogenase